MHDTRLDFISNIRPEMIEEMTSIRQAYINLDERIKLYENLPGFKDSVAARTIGIARTQLETALQFTIKSLCLIGELK